MAEIVWGVDLGGTKIEGVVLQLSGGDRSEFEVLSRKRIPTEQAGGYEHILSRIDLLVRELEAEVGRSRGVIGIGTPGVSDPKTGLHKNSNTLCYNGRPLHLDLHKVLNTQVNIANDANCFALAEATLGAARGAECVFGVILGTGVGGGVILNGKARHGHHGIAGEWGHNVLIPDGPMCYCGKRGCVESIISGPALERYYQERTGSKIPLSEIASRADEGEAEASYVLNRLSECFAQAIAVVINILDPDAVVLGGGVSNIPLLYSRGVQLLTHYVFCDTVETKIVQNSLGDSAGVFGAAMLST